MIRRAFDEGAGKVLGISIGTPDVGASKTIGALFTANGTNATITVNNNTGVTNGDTYFIGTGSAYEYEEKKVVLSSTSTTITFTTPLEFDHYVGETVTKVTPKVASAYQTAIDVMSENQDKGMVVCEDNSNAVAALIATAVSNSFSLYNTPVMYVRGSEYGDTASAAILKSTAMNNKRSVLVYPNLVAYSGRTLDGGETASALAGLITGAGVPKLNYNFLEFSSVGGVASKILDFDALINAGITPIEFRANSIHIVRFLTTRTLDGVVPDRTWAEGAVRLNVDYLEKTLQRRIASKFLDKGNTAQVRLAIKTECISALQTFASTQVIVPDEATGTPAFKEPVVTTDANDATKVNVQIEILPAKPLNFITLNFTVLL